MKSILLSLLFVWVVGAAKAADSRRQVISLDGQWQIAEGNLTQIPTTFSRTVPVPGLVSLAVPAFDNPGPIVANPTSQQQKDPKRDAFWYRRTFTLNGPIPAVARLKVGKAMFGTRVYLNGVLLGDHMPSFTAGYFNAASALNTGNNEIVVRVGADRDAVPPEYPDGLDFEKERYIPGIFDSVELILSGTPNFISVQAAPKIASNSVRVQAVLANGGTSSSNAAVSFIVREKVSGQIAGQVTSSQVNFPAGVETTVDVTIPIANSHLWSPEDPFLYSLEVDSGTDSFQTRFGMREFKFDPVTKQPILNGKPYFMRGTNFTLYRFFEDSECGALPWSDNWVRLLHQRMKDMHWNCVRYCIGFMPEKWYEIADEVGILIQDEFPLWHFGEIPAEIPTSQLVTEYSEWMRERWNHPSVVLWDSCNETRSAKTSEALTIVRGMDLSNRPWDNGWGYPQAPTDTSEQHPYHFQYAQYTLNKLDGAPSGGGGAHPVVINEYGWLWLNRDGTPTSLAAGVYANLLGPNATPAQRLHTQGTYIAAESEFWRSHRDVAVLMHFTSLGYSRPGGATSDHWKPGGVASLEWEPEFYKYVRDSFAPVGLMVEFWKSRAGMGAPVLIPVTLINDLEMPWQGTVTLRVKKDNTVLYSAQKAANMGSYGKTSVSFDFVWPNTPGPIVLEAEIIGADGSPVKSTRDLKLVPRSDVGAQFRTMTASSVFGGYSPKWATDDDDLSYWSSNFNDNEWVMGDLGSGKSINRLKLLWEAAYAKDFTIQFSGDGNNWTELHRTTNGSGEAVNLTFSPITARYFRVNCSKRGTTFGNGVRNLEVFETPREGAWNTTDGIWDTVTPNWSPDGIYTNGDAVIFDRTTGGTITQVGLIAPSSTTVSATSGTYTFRGSGITTGSLSKSGAGTLVLNSNGNTYLGPTTVGGGTLRLQSAAPVLPSSISGLVVQLDANDINGNNTNPANGSLVTTWTNKAAGGAGNFTLLPGSGTGGVLGSAGGSLMNGLSLVHFDRASILRNTTNFGQNLTVMYVGRMSGGSNQRLVSSNANNWLLGYFGGKMNVDHWSNSPSHLTGVAADYNSHIFVATADGTSESAYNADGNEYSQSPTTPLGAGQGPNGIALGGVVGPANGNPSVGNPETSYGDIGELLVFNRALTAAERLQMEQYLQSKWSGILPVTTALSLTSSGTTVDINGVNQTVGSLAGVAGSSVLLGGNVLTAGGDNTSTVFSGTLSGTGGSLVKYGTGTLTLNGPTSNSYTGTTVVNNGAIVLSKTGGAKAIPGNLTFYNGPSPDVYTLLDNQFAGGAVVSFESDSGDHGRLDLMGTTQTVAGIQTVGYIGSRGVVENSEAIPNTGSSTLVLNGSGSYSFTGFLRGQTGTLSLTKGGTGTQILSGVNISHTGITNVTGGKLTLNNTPGWNSNIVNSATIELAAETGVAWMIGAPRTFSGSGIYTKSGAGTVKLNNHTIAATGQMLIQGGTLQNDWNNCVWTNCTANMDISAGAILDLYADAIYVNGLTGAGVVQNNYGNPTGQSGSSGSTEKLVVGVNGAGNAVFSGVIRNNATGSALGFGVGKGGVEFVKTGSGTQVLAGSNTYTGRTTISGGTLQLGSGSTTGSLAASSEIINNGNLVLVRSNVAIQGVDFGVISGSGSFTQAGAGTTNLASNNTYTGNTVVTGGVLGLTGNSIADTGKLVIGGGKINVPAGANETVNSLSFGSIGQPAGTYGSSTSGAANKDDSRFSGSGIVTVLGTANSAYQQWLAAFPAITGDDQFEDVDYDRDGLSNSVEFVLGGDPAHGDVGRVAPTAALATDPVGTPPIPVGDYVVFTFRRTNSSVDDGVSSIVETSPTLSGTWTPAIDGMDGVVIQVDENFDWADPPATNTDRVRVYIPRGAHDKLFARLRVNP